MHLGLASLKKGIKPDDPPQDVGKSHLSSITNLDETCSLDSSCDHLLHLDSPSNPSETQDTSSVESVEIGFIDESEKPLENNKLPPTDFSLEHHDYDLFLLNQDIDTPSDNLNHQDTHVCENQDDILIHASNLSHTFALPQFMAQYNYEVLKPSDTPSTVPTAIQASSNQPSILGVLITQWKPSAINLSNLTLSTTTHYPNSWYKPTVKTWSPLILQLQYQTHSKLPLITPSILNMLIT